jgi:hypothetical protein
LHIRKRDLVKKLVNFKCPLDLNLISLKEFNMQGAFFQSGIFEENGEHVLKLIPDSRTAPPSNSGLILIPGMLK